MLVYGWVGYAIGFICGLGVGIIATVVYCVAHVEEDTDERYSENF